VLFGKKQEGYLLIKSFALSISVAVLSWSALSTISVMVAVGRLETSFTLLEKRLDQIQESLSSMDKRL
jgi:hypothetical protein